MPTTNAPEDTTFMDRMLDEFKESAKGVQQFASTVGSLVAGGASAVQGNKAAGDAAYGKEQTAIMEGGKAAAEENTLKGQAAINERNDNAIAAQTIGVDSVGIANRNEHIRHLGSDITSIDQQLTEADNTSIFDEPLKYITNLFTTPALTSQRKSLLQEYTDSTKFLKDAQETTKESFAINSSIDKAVGDQIYDAQNKQILAKAMQDAAKSGEDAAKFDNSALSTALSMNIESFDINYKAMVTKANVIDQTMQVENFEASNLGKAANSALKQNKVEELESNNRNLQLLSTFTNRPAPFTVGEYNGMPTKLKGVYDNILTSALTAGSYGVTPVDSFKNTQDAGIPPATGSELLTRNYIGKAIAQASNIGNWKQTAPQEQRQILEDAVTNTVAKELRSIPPSGGIYSPPTLSRTLMLPMVAATDIGKALIPSGSVDSSYPTKAEDLMSTAIKLGSEGKIAPGILASQLTTIAKAMQAATSVTNMAQKYRLPVLGSDRAMGGQYNMAVPDINPTLFGSSFKVLDFNNTGQLESYITRSILNKQRTKADGEFTNPAHFSSKSLLK